MLCKFRISGDFYSTRNVILCVFASYWENCVCLMLCKTQQKDVFFFCSGCLHDRCVIFVRTKRNARVIMMASATSYFSHFAVSLFYWICFNVHIVVVSSLAVFFFSSEFFDELSRSFLLSPTFVKLETQIVALLFIPTNFII